MRNSIKPVVSGKLPHPINSIVTTHVVNQETILKAAINMDKDLAFSAFLNDPQINIDYDDAKKLFDEMLENTKEYLPGWGI